MQVHLCQEKKQKKQDAISHNHTQRYKRRAEETLQSDNQRSFCKLKWQEDRRQTDARDTEQKKRWMKISGCSVKSGKVAYRLLASTSHGHPLSSSPAQSHPDGQRHTSSACAHTHTHTHGTQGTHTYPCTSNVVRILIAKMHYPASYLNHPN